MKHGIAIVSHPENKDWMWNCLSGLDKSVPRVVVVNDGFKEAPYYYEKRKATGETFLLRSDDGWELGALKTALEFTDWDEIFLMQDTVEVKDNSVWKTIFEDNELRDVSVFDRYLCYLGKYIRGRLPPIEVPVDKRDAVEMESRWNGEYLKGSDVLTLSPGMRDSNVFVEKFGKRRMVIENDWFRKYKGTWNASML